MKLPSPSMPLALRPIILASLPSALFTADVDMDRLDDALESKAGTCVALTHTGTNPNTPGSVTFVIPSI